MSPRNCSHRVRSILPPDEPRRLVQAISGQLGQRVPIKRHSYDSGHSLPRETIQEVVDGYAECDQVVDHRYGVKTPCIELVWVICRYTAAPALVQERVSLKRLTYFIWLKTGWLISTLETDDERSYSFVLQEHSPIQTREPFTGCTDEPKCEEENPQFSIPTTNPVCPASKLENYLACTRRDYPPTSAQG